MGRQFLAVYAHVDAQSVNESAFNECQMLLIGYWYAYMPQGRPSGIVDLRTSQVEQLLTDGVATSDRFKTQLRYGYQPVANVIEAIPFLTKVCEWRIRAVQNNGGFESSDYLLLIWKGDRALNDVNFSARLTAFFRPMDLHITFNGLRTLQETRAAEMIRLGVITAGDGAAISSINGHTGEVAREYYQRADQIHHVHVAREAMGAITAYEQQQQPENDRVIAAQPSSHFALPPSSYESVSACPVSPIGAIDEALACAAEDLERTDSLRRQTRSASLPVISPIPCDPMWATRDRMRPFQWGTMHPDINRKTASGSPAVRFRWSFPEKGYIRDFLRTECTVFTKNVAALCLKAIQRDPHAIAIFHPNHTLNSMRLQEGFNQVRQDDKKAAKEEEERAEMLASAAVSEAVSAAVSAAVGGIISV